MHVARCVMCRRRTCQGGGASCKHGTGTLTLVCTPQVTVFHTFVGVPGGYLWVRLATLVACPSRASEGAEGPVTGAMLGHLLFGSPSAAPVYTGVLRKLL